LSHYFLDSSALVKRYVDEVGSEWVRGITDSSTQHTIVIAEIGIVEVAAAFAARFRAHAPLNLSIQERSLRLFLRDCSRRYIVIGTNRRTIDLAVQLTRRHRLRGYDAVQLAYAIIANESLKPSGQPALTLITADKDLEIAASNEHLPTANPLNH
jgi:predicted nucleic acid-binding protein